MKKINQICSVAVIGLGLLSGCATAGNDSLKGENQQTVSQKITVGKTTMSEVKAIFGTPLSTSYTDSGLEIWKYEITHLSADATRYIPVVNMFAGSSSGTKKELVILFDEKGKIRKYKMDESPVKVRTGLFNQ